MGFLELKHLHVTAAALTALAFMVRGMLVWRQSAWAERKWLRRASHGIDTVLLGAALGMLWVGQRNPFAEPWLSAKLACLLAYIVVGALALKRAPTLGMRRRCFVVALLLLANIVAIALTRDPWGIAAGLRPPGY